MQPAAYSPPYDRSAGAGSYNFPILTLDEQRLTPSLGYIFDKRWLDPCESLVSILWKFETVNALPGLVVARLMGPDIDPNEGVTPQLGLVDLARLRRTLGIPIAPLEIALLHPSQRRRYSPLFRYCRNCISRGYHSVLHQMLMFHHCPAHYRPLETACRRCGYEAPYKVNVLLLESPHRCAFCGCSYGGDGWSPDRARPMRAKHRIAFTRRYYDRHLG
ncbi:hypothetical protein QHI69_38095 (plasmid) [Burkholderia gladioli pv. gladioli]|uniref:TniQ family protein n=1 Tax=Burkholderia gladioli TaxID=28095 RepID=A0AAW3ERS1_BURGA|nr:hypothetical protein [Burkholderia gladioli]AJW93817.1 hypothetical protein BM43_7456 [Burkholderia gladioli]KGC10451.1 hypothetical protein DM48_6858 [Burkholderia gladioli]MDJ1167731.1 hypothetical protein [Burkholderia gladioli pv. gladioli]SPU96363.1 Uncharacterised protein [Burkholderia gladioli]